MNFMLHSDIIFKVIGILLYVSHFMQPPKQSWLGLYKKMIPILGFIP